MRPTRKAVKRNHSSAKSVFINSWIKQVQDKVKELLPLFQAINCIRLPERSIRKGSDLLKAKIFKAL